MTLRGQTEALVNHVSHDIVLYRNVREYANTGWDFSAQEDNQFTATLDIEDVGTVKDEADVWDEAYCRTCAATIAEDLTIP